jgi:signal recognition particle GTPase
MRIINACSELIITSLAAFNGKEHSDERSVRDIVKDIEVSCLAQQTNYRVVREASE